MTSRSDQARASSRGRGLWGKREGSQKGLRPPEPPVEPAQVGQAHPIGGNQVAELEVGGVPDLPSRSQDPQ